MIDIRLGLRANARQFGLLVALNVLVGAMVGLERSVLPLIGKDDFGLRSSAAILAFVVAFGAAKALTNLAAGQLAERVGRKRLLVLGWLLALPVPALIGLAPSWWLIVAANVLLGANQGLAWSMTVVMKLDLAGPRRRGLALGVNESAGYLGVAFAAFATGALAAGYAPRTVVWVGGALVASAGLLLSILTVRDTTPHVDLEQAAHGPAPARSISGTFLGATFRDRRLRACNIAGLVNNLNDAVSWGLAPLYLAAHDASIREIGIVAAAYPVVWGAGQLATGWLSDVTGRKALISGGMVVQSGGLVLLVAAQGGFSASLAAALLLGAGTAMVYPTLLAAVSDATEPVVRARVVGIYRFWRDSGFVVGAVVAGIAADATSAGTAILVVAALTAASGVVVTVTPWEPADAMPATGSLLAASMSTFDDYLANVPEPQKAELERIRRFVRRIVPEAEEATSYGMPAFKYKQRPLLGFRASKNHLSVFPFSPEAVDAAREALAGLDLSKGTVRFTPEKPIPDAALELLLRHRLRELERA